MAKAKISITIDEKLIKTIDKVLKNKQFRNRSHVLEYSLSKFMEDKK